jgi:predicted transcriptional regulator
MSSRPPVNIAYLLLREIKDNEEVNRWGLIRILGNNRQFHHWVTDFLVSDGFVTETEQDGRYSYRLTDDGELLYKVLKKGNFIGSIFKLRGRRLRA